ncbi:MAG: hypothetical protein HYT79_12460 [Elusimicrobia bacterium]|nr:hypothetical protein [Elusimicrobiota bacterium]
MKTLITITFILNIGVLLAEVPQNIVVQGRTFQPLATISGTATILPSGFNQPFSVQTDKEGVFQFDLTGLSSDVFSSKDSSLRLQIGTTTIDIPFRTVPFAFRAATADAVPQTASLQITSMTVTNVTASSATIEGQLKVGSGLSVGPNTIEIGATAAGTNNEIRFTGSNTAGGETFGGRIVTAGGVGGPGPLLFRSAGATNIILDSGGDVEIPGNDLSFTGAAPRSISAAGRLNILAGGTEPLLINPGVANNVGIGVPAATPPVNKLDVAGATAIGAAYAGTNSAPTNGLIVEGAVGVGTFIPSSTLEVAGNIEAGGLLDNDGSNFFEEGASEGSCAGGTFVSGIGANGALACGAPAATEADGVIGNEILNATNTTLTRSGAGTSADPYTLGLNLANANTWTTAQTFGSGANFPGSGIWNTSGNVGIGTSNPESILHVVGQNSTFDVPIPLPNVLTAIAGSNTTPFRGPVVAGGIILRGGFARIGGSVEISAGNAFSSGGSVIINAGTGSASHSDGLVHIASNRASLFVGPIPADFLGLPTEKLDVNGNAKFRGNIFVSGTKSFVMDHPTNPDKQIIYYALEGPEAGTFARGTSQLTNGQAVIQLPDHFGFVTSQNAPLTVQVTPWEECNGLYVAQRDTSRIIVKELKGGTSNIKFDYLVQGIRKGYENAAIIQDKPKPVQGNGINPTEQ